MFRQRHILSRFVYFRFASFRKVVEWFADRSDLIFLVFDAHKLDMGGEFREVMSAIKQHGDRVSIKYKK